MPAPLAARAIKLNERQLNAKLTWGVNSWRPASDGYFY